jgi:hypothetical protein
VFEKDWERLGESGIFKALEGVLELKLEGHYVKGY